MTDVLQTGTTWLASQLSSYASHEVTYVRGADSVAISASFGRTEMEIDGAAGQIRLSHTDRDFIIAAADLVLSGSQVEPQEGDEIQEIVNGITHTYEVMSPDGMEEVFRYCDASRVMLRIHTKLVATA